MSPDVVDVVPLANHKLALTFENGERGVFDCSEYVHKGIFKELQDERYFRMVQLWREAGTIRWPHGQDFSPDTLYLNAKQESDR
jgi:hypothetical protein